MMKYLGLLRKISPLLAACALYGVFNLVFLLRNQHGYVLDRYFKTYSSPVILQEVASEYSEKKPLPTETMHNDYERVERFPESHQNYVSGEDNWQYVTTNATNSSLFVYKQVWLDTRKDVHDAPALRVNFIYPGDMYQKDVREENSEIKHTGYVNILNQTYKLKGHVVRYGHSKCYKDGLLVFCRHIVMFYLGFLNFNEEDLLDVLDKKFVYLIESSQAVGNELEIQFPVKGKHKGRFVVCCKPLFGIYNDEQLRNIVEWVEMNKLLGISEIHIYNSSMTRTPAFDRIFDYYRDEGVMFLHHIGDPLSGLVTDDETSSEVLQASALNDCFYRQMSSFDYVLVIDVDELFIPVQQMTIGELLDDLMEERPAFYTEYISISSTWAFYYKEDNVNVTTSKVLELTQLYSLPISRGKAITNTKTCPYLGQHSCAMTNFGYKNKFKLSFNVSRVHHYRIKCKYHQMCDPDTLEIGVNHTSRYKPHLQDKLAELYDFFLI